MERNRAYSLLQNEAAGCVDDESAAAHRQDCRSLLHEMIGEGYDLLELHLLQAIQVS